MCEVRRTAPLEVVTLISAGTNPSTVMASIILVNPPLVFWKRIFIHSLFVSILDTLTSGYVFNKINNLDHPIPFCKAYDKNNKYIYVKTTRNFVGIVQNTSTSIPQLFISCVTSTSDLSICCSCDMNNWGIEVLVF